MQESKDKTTNDLSAAVPKFCLAMEQDRRSPEGRIRTDKEFRQYFFPYDDKSATDRILRRMPNEVRGPIIASWGIRGQKSALRDDDDRVLSVVHDALVANDIDDQTFEEGITADLMVGWGDLSDWWTFWRGGRQTKHSIQRALETGHSLSLFDARWFLETVEARSGKLRGTEVLADGLNKLELTDWIKKIHESGDGSPKGILAALGWESIVAKTANEVLLSVMDAMAQKNGLTTSAKVGDKAHEKPAGHDKAAGAEKSAAEKPAPDKSADAKANLSDPDSTAQTPSLGAAGARLEGEGNKKGAAIAAVLAESRAAKEKGDAKPDETDWLDNPVSVRPPPTDGGDDLDVIVDTSAISGPTSGGDPAGGELLHSEPGTGRSPGLGGLGGGKKEGRFGKFKG